MPLLAHINKVLIWVGSVKARYKAVAIVSATLAVIFAGIGPIADFISIYQVLGAPPSRQGLIDKMGMLEKNRQWPELVKVLNSIRSDGVYADVQMYYSGVVSCRWDHYEKMSYSHYFSSIGVDSSLYEMAMWRWLKCAIDNKRNDAQFDIVAIGGLIDKLKKDNYYDVVYYVSSLVTDNPSYDYVSKLRESAIYHLGNKYDFDKNSVLINKVGADRVDQRYDYTLSLSSLGTLFDLAMAHTAGIARKDTELNIYTKKSCKTLLSPPGKRRSNFPVNIIDFYAENLSTGIGIAGMEHCKAIVSGKT